MDLTTGKMLWQESYKNPPVYPSLGENISCDVVVFGGGEAGALCAYYLSEHGMDTVLVEKRKIASGSTGANTGLLQVSNDMPLHQMIDVHGQDDAVRFYRLCRTALDDLESLVRSLGNPFGNHASDPDGDPVGGSLTESAGESVGSASEFVRRESLYFASKAADVKHIMDEYDSLSKHGFAVRKLNKQELADQYGLQKEAGLVTTGDAEFNPYRLTHALVGHCARKNVRVYEDTEVASFHFRGQAPTFRTTQGNVIRAKQAVFCMGYETQDYEKTPGAVLTSSYAMATEPIEESLLWKERCLIWETARPYLYLRTTRDNRVIVGGLDGNAPYGRERDEHVFDRTEQLYAEMVALFPVLSGARVDFRWAATFGNSQDGVPFIGRHPAYPNCYLALGYGGNGTVYYVIAAKVIRDMIRKASNLAWAEALLQPNRLRWDKALVQKIEHLFTPGRS